MTSGTRRDRAFSLPPHQGSAGYSIPRAELNLSLWLGPSGGTPDSTRAEPPRDPATRERRAIQLGFRPFTKPRQHTRPCRELPPTPREDLALLVRRCCRAARVERERWGAAAAADNPLS